MLVFVAASATDAVNELAKQFDPAHPDRVRISAGASGSLARQILAGAPADLFLSASPEWATALNEKNLASQTVPLLGNELVFVVPAGAPADLKSPANVLSQPSSKIALADESAPVGKYAQQWLRFLDSYEPLLAGGHIVRAPDVRAVLAFVEHKDASAAIVYSTDAAISSQVEIRARAGPRSHDPIVYPLVLTARGADRAAAVRFFDHLTSEAARGIYLRFGFVVLPK